MRKKPVIKPEVILAFSRECTSTFVDVPTQSVAPHRPQPHDAPARPKAIDTILDVIKRFASVGMKVIPFITTLFGAVAGLIHAIARFRGTHPHRGTA